LDEEQTSGPILIVIEQEKEGKKNVSMVWNQAARRGRFDQDGGVKKSIRQNPEWCFTED